ncbi:hypothetical protein OROMI_015422 [Orobanche minor]
MFKRYAGINDNFSKNLISKGHKIAKECKRLPVAIAVIASSLKGQQLRKHEWDATLKSLKKHVSMHGVDDDMVGIYKCLKFSYDYMKDEKAKGLFLLSSVFPEDKEIPIEILTRLGIGKGLLGKIMAATMIRAGTFRFCQLFLSEPTRNRTEPKPNRFFIWIGSSEPNRTVGSYAVRIGSAVPGSKSHSPNDDARTQAVVAKNKLIDSCLLVEVVEAHVKMHDLVRDAAQWIANKEIRGGRKWICFPVSMMVPNLRHSLSTWIEMNTANVWKSRILSLKILSINPFEVIERCSALEELCFIDSFNGFCREITYLSCKGGDAYFFSKATLKYCMQTTEALQLYGIKEGWRNLMPEIVPVDLDWKIWKKFDSLKNLEELSIQTVKLWKCRMLVSLFPLLTARNLVLLEELQIDDCKGLKSIIIDEKREEESREEISESDNDNKSHVSMFSKLKVLDIEGCHRLESILPILSSQDFPHCNVAIKSIGEFIIHSVSESLDSINIQDYEIGVKNFNRFQRLEEESNGHDRGKENPSAETTEDIAGGIEVETTLGNELTSPQNMQLIGGQ